MISNFPSRSNISTNLLASNLGSLITSSVVPLINLKIPVLNLLKNKTPLTTKMFEISSSDSIKENSFVTMLIK